MKAVRVHEFGDVDVLKVDELPDPVPAAGQVPIRIHAAGVSPLDTYVREQSHGALPYIPGFEAAGEIAAIDENRSISNSQGIITTIKLEVIDYAGFSYCSD